jgi:hypothetical protein
MGNQKKLLIEGQTIEWSIDREKGKQRSAKH